MREAAELLARDRDALAMAVTEAVYRRHPDLLEKHGERGRAKCLQDMRLNVDQLVPAVDLGDEAMFARYVEWLDDMLRSRNVGTRDVVSCLELLRAECFRRFPALPAGEIGRIIDAGLRVVQSPAS